MEFKTAKLDNGLELVAEINDQTKSSALGFFVMTGGRDDSVPGISHFLEHMIFKGSKKRTALQVSYDLGNLGVQANAYTAPENTVYYGSVVSKYFSDYQELLSDMMRPSLVQAEFDTEKNVILEEVALYKDRPGFYLDELARKNYFGSHPLSISVLGSTETVASITRDQMHSYFTSRYTPKNMILCASGNLDWNKFVDDANKYCGDWDGESKSRLVQDYTNPTQKEVFKKVGLSQTYLYIFSRGVSVHSEDNYAFSVLSTILGDHTNSKFYWDLVDTGLVDSFDCDHEAYTDCGVFSVSVSTSDENLTEVKSRIYNILNNLSNFSDKELESAKAKLALRLVSSGESTAGRLFAVGLNWLNKKEYLTIHELINKVRNVSREDLERVIKLVSNSKFSEYALQS